MHVSQEHIDRIYQTMYIVQEYLGDSDDWITVKKELLKFLPWESRTLFSTRHPLTKEHSLNDFEIKLIDKWQEMTGNKLVLRKLYD